MQSDPLQQLRDVHSPLDPAWWPPAPGWWIIAILALCLLTWLVWQAWRAWTRRAPIRAATREHKHYAAAFANGQMAATDYLHRCNELLKRILVRSYQRKEYAPLSGDAWLSALDRLSESTQFTEGPGKVLGNNRFSPTPDIEPRELRPLIEKAIRATVNVA